MSTFREEDDGYFAERPEIEDPDLSKDDYYDAMQINLEQIRGAAVDTP